MPERTEQREEEDVEVEEEDLDDVEPTEEDLEDAATPPADPEGEADVESIQEVLEKQEARDDEDEAEDEEPIPPTAAKGDDRLEAVDARVVPMQATEFVCKNCYLVKHRSQLADKRRMFCRDCA